MPRQAAALSLAGVVLDRAARHIRRMRTLCADRQAALVAPAKRRLAGLLSSRSQGSGVRSQKAAA